MKKHLVLALVIIMSMAFTHAPQTIADAKKTKLPTCTCNISFFNSCLNVTVDYKIYFDCVTGVPTWIDAFVGGVQYTTQGFVTNSFDQTFDFAIIDGCDFIHMRGNYYGGCNVTMNVFRCVPGGACLAAKK